MKQNTEQLKKIEEIKDKLDLIRQIAYDMESMVSSDLHQAQEQIAQLCYDIEALTTPHLISSDEIKREATHLLGLSNRVHAMFKDAVDPSTVSGYNEALDDVQDVIQECLGEVK